MPHDRPGDTKDPVLRRARRLARRRMGLVAVVLALAIAVPGWGLAGPELAGLSVGLAKPAEVPLDVPGFAGDLRDDLLGLAADGFSLAAEEGALSALEPVVADPNATLVAAEAEATVDASDIPPVALRAYMRAERVLGTSDPECGLRWWLLAAVGRVESDHGRYQGVVLDEDGFGSRPIRGIPLDGRGGVSRVADTDDGELDGDPRVDRAMGPMQFIPATWERVGVDADGDGERNADNIFDAATAAGVHLCSGDVDLGNPAQLRAALLRYNPSDQYAAVVTRIALAYQNGDGLGSVGLEYGVPEFDDGWGGRGRLPRLPFDRELELPDVGTAPLPPANPANPPGVAVTPGTPSPAPKAPAPSGPTPTPPTTPTTVPPSRPTDPSPPTAPSAPAGPTDPTAPPTTAPPRPTQPADPTAPTGPAEPTGPGQPGEPTLPPACPPGTTPVTSTTSTTSTSTTTTATTATTATTTTTTTTVPGQPPPDQIPPGCEVPAPDASAPDPTAPTEAPTDGGGAPAPTGAVAVPLLAVLTAVPTLRRRPERPGPPER
jgi:hypothetical protein